MKKLLTILSSFTVATTSGSTLIACGKTKGQNGNQNPTPNPNDLTSQEKADKAKNELSSLDITVSIGDDEKTKDKVIDHIKNVNEVKTITDQYEATISELTVKLDDDSDLEDANIADNLVLKVSGTLTVDAATANFSLTKVTLKVLDPNVMHKQIANDTVAKLSNLTGIKIDIENIGSDDKVNFLTGELILNDKITNIVKIGENNIALEDDKFTLKVNGVDATDNNLVENATVSVSGKINVKGQVSDSEFKFDIVLESNPEHRNRKVANEAAEKLSALTDIIIKTSDLGASNKAATLDTKLHAHAKIAAIINNNTTVEGGKFTFKVHADDATDNNLIDTATVTVSGKIKVNEQTSDIDFSFDIELWNTAPTADDKEADKKVAQLSNLTGIIFKPIDLGSSNKAAELKNKLLSNPAVKAIIDGNNTKLDGEFTFKVGNQDANNKNLKDNAIVTVSGKIKFKKSKLNKEFQFNVRLEESPEDIAALKLSELEFKGIKIKASDINPRWGTSAIWDRIYYLNDNLLKKNEDVKKIIDGTNVKLAGEKFTLVYRDNPVKNDDLVAGNYIVVSGHININGNVSTEEFEFIIELI